MAASATTGDPLEEARWLCKRNRAIWFETAYRRNGKTGEQEEYFRIFRRGMGCVAERSSASALVAYLRKQIT